MHSLISRTSYDTNFEVMFIRYIQESNNCGTSWTSSNSGAREWRTRKIVGANPTRKSFCWPEMGQWKKIKKETKFMKEFYWSKSYFTSKLSTGKGKQLIVKYLRVGQYNHIMEVTNIFHKCKVKTLCHKVLTILNTRQIIHDRK